MDKKYIGTRGKTRGEVLKSLVDAMLNASEMLEHMSSTPESAELAMQGVKISHYSAMAPATMVTVSLLLDNREILSNIQKLLEHYTNISVISLEDTGESQESDGE